VTDERQPESADQIEDLDVPAEERDVVKGGIQDGTSNTLMVGEAVAGDRKATPGLMKACATGKHLPEVTITH
jgi:type VI protein secretion system component Hcp